MANSASTTGLVEQSTTGLVEHKLYDFIKISHQIDNLPGDKLWCDPKSHFELTTNLSKLYRKSKKADLIFSSILRNGSIAVYQRGREWFIDDMQFIYGPVANGFAYTTDKISIVIEENRITIINDGVRIWDEVHNGSTWTLSRDFDEYRVTRTYHTKDIKYRGPLGYISCTHRNTNTTVYQAKITDGCVRWIKYWHSRDMLMLNLLPTNMFAMGMGNFTGMGISTKFGICKCVHNADADMKSHGMCLDYDNPNTIGSIWSHGKLLVELPKNYLPI